MKFDIERTTAHFGVFNPREEKNKGPACDIPFSLTTSAGLLGMLLPALTEADEDADDGINLIGELFNDEGIVRRPSLNPLTVHRMPEGIEVTIWDREDFNEPIILKACRIKGLSVALASPHQITLSGKIQHSQYTDDELLSISHLMNADFDVQFKAEQVDMFETGDEPKAEDQQKLADVVSISDPVAPDDWPEPLESKDPLDGAISLDDLALEPDEDDD